MFIVALVMHIGFVFSPCSAMQFLVSFIGCNHFAVEARAGCFTLIVFLLIVAVSVLCLFLKVLP